MNNNMDTLFIMSTKGNTDCYNQLFESFLEIGKVISLSTISAFGASHYVGPSDLYEVICELFLTAIKTYNPHSSNFEAYARFILNKRLIRSISDIVKRGDEIVISLDQVDNDEKPLLEKIEDKSIAPIPNQVSVSRFEQQMLYKTTRGNAKRAKQNKIIRMLYEGYSKNEIADKLGISMGKLKYLLKLAEKNLQLDKIKMELK